MTADEETVPTRHQRRRRETRERIADTALTLFAERGYDAVTIAEIAATADVAKQTVVNHFPAKEDLLLAWHRPVEADLIEMIDQVPLSTPLPAFLREELPRMFAGIAEVPEADPGQDPRTTADERLARVGAVIQSSPALLDALKLRGGRYQDDLAAILADRVPAELGVVAARAVAAYILTTVTAMINEAGRLRADGRPPQEVATTLTDTVGRAFDVLESGIGPAPAAGA
jgi:AcrR family transcriptional regulator